MNTAREHIESILAAGEAYRNGQRMAGGEALRRAGLRPLALAAVRGVVPALQEDRPLASGIDALASALRAGAFNAWCDASFETA